MTPVSWKSLKPTRFEVGFWFHIFLGWYISRSQWKTRFDGVLEQFCLGIFTADSLKKMKPDEYLGSTTNSVCRVSFIGFVLKWVLDLCVYKLVGLSPCPGCTTRMQPGIPKVNRLSSAMIESREKGHPNSFFYRFRKPIVMHVPSLEVFCVQMSSFF